MIKRKKADFPWVSERVMFISEENWPVQFGDRDSFYIKRDYFKNSSDTKDMYIEGIAENITLDGQHYPIIIKVSTERKSNKDVLVKKTIVKEY